MRKESNAQYAKAFGRFLCQLRTDKKLTQLQLAFRSRVSVSHISRIERGIRSPTIEVIYHLALGLEIEPKKLLEFG